MNLLECTYRVKAAARDEFVELLRKHWPTLQENGLASDTPAIVFEAEAGGDNNHNEKGTTFVEIFREFPNYRPLPLDDT